MGIHCNSRDHLQLHLTTKEQTPRPPEIKLIGRIHRCNYNFTYLYIYIRINNLRLPLHLQAGEKRTITSGQKDGKWSARHGGLETNTAATCTYHGSTDNTNNR
ncbi:hypothetical protein VPH35_098433 [Triticum aestivum]